MLRAHSPASSFDIFRTVAHTELSPRSGVTQVILA